MGCTPNKMVETVEEAQQVFTKTYPVEKLRVPVDLLPYGVDPANKEVSFLHSFNFRLFLLFEIN